MTSAHAETADRARTGWAERVGAALGAVVGFGTVAMLAWCFLLHEF